MSLLLRETPAPPTGWAAGAYARAMVAIVQSRSTVFYSYFDSICNLDLTVNQHLPSVA